MSNVFFQRRFPPNRHFRHAAAFGARRLIPKPTRCASARGENVRCSKTRAVRNRPLLENVRFQRLYGRGILVNRYLLKGNRVWATFDIECAGTSFDGGGVGTNQADVDVWQVRHRAMTVCVLPDREPLSHSVCSHISQVYSAVGTNQAHHQALHASDFEVADSTGRLGGALDVGKSKHTSQVESEQKTACSRLRGASELPHATQVTSAGLCNPQTIPSIHPGNTSNHPHNTPKTPPKHPTTTKPPGQISNEVYTTRQVMWAPRDFRESF